MHACVRALWPAVWRMIPCASPQLVLHSSSFLPLTHSWSHTLRLACTHLQYVWGWLQANSCPRSWNRDFRGEVKRSLVLFLQEHVNLKQTRKQKRKKKKEKESPCAPQSTQDCASFRAVWFELSRLLAGRPTPIPPSPSALNGWHTAVLHWQALCSCAHTKAASWRTALVSPAPDDSRRGSGWGVWEWVGVGRTEEGGVSHTWYSEWHFGSHHCLYFCVNQIQPVCLEFM